MRKTFIQPECGTCCLETALKFLKEGTEDQKLIIEGMNKVFSILASDFDTGGYTFFIGNKMARAITAHLGIEDIFQKIKEQSNEACLSIYPDLLERYTSLETLDEKLDFTLNACVAGNIIDVGTAGHDFDLDPNVIFQTIDQIKDQGFAVDDREKLKSLILDDSKKRFLLMLDNAGEVVFDKLLVLLLKDWGKYVACMVRGKSIANDVTKADLVEVEMDKICDEIIETSIASLGYTIADNDQNVIDHVNSMDVIIGKGQANLETLATYIDDIPVPHVFSLSRIKCKTVAKFQGVNMGDNFLRQLE